MTSSSWKTPVLVIADDFTGANDAGSGLARAGARVHVLFNGTVPDDPHAADVWVISTDSRAVNAEDAATRITNAFRQHQTLAQQGWVFKKIDSTLRGNVGVEVSTALAASGKRLALVVPAVPRLGRITRQGQVYINDVLLTETEFASDPKTPIVSANVLEQLRIQGRTIDLATLHSDALPDVLQQLDGVVVVDAEQEADIARLMSAAAQLPETPLLVGAAGLSDALGAELSSQNTRSVLAVVGSMSHSAHQQIAQLVEKRDITLVDVEIRQLFAQPAWPDAQQWIDTSLSALRAGQHVVIRTCQHAGQRHEIDQLCAQHQVTRQQLGDDICQFLGQLAHALCRAHQPAGLYLSGGDVAIAVAQALGADGFQIQGLVAGCVPHGVLLNSEFTLPVMTKAGGFGDENTLVDAIRFIEEKSSE